MSMLYIGHFYFDGQGSDGEERCGHFTCLAEADSVEKSVKKFMEHIHEIRDSSHLFDGSFEIYLDDVVEIQRLPEKAISLDFMSSSGEDPHPVSFPISSDDSDFFAIYDWVPDALDDEEDYEDEPIIRFEPKRRSHKSVRRKRHLRLVK
jgi:hypothetical protein